MNDMIDTQKLHTAILEKLSTVIDPETGVDVVRMRLIEDLTVDETGKVKYRFRPSSPLCPIAVPLANLIQMAVAKVPGVTSQEIEVVDFILSDELMELLKRTLADLQSEGKEKKSG
jgi:metal-sulfur cluster biosynthetic enzyme